MIKVNLKKLKAYGDRQDDGVIQLSFTLPVSASPEAKEAAKRYCEKLGLEKISIAAMESMGPGFSYFVVYGHSRHTIDFTKISVPKIEIPEMDYSGLKEYMAANIGRPIVVIGATTGSDAHTVGIDAIMNMKGYAGDFGLERYPLFKTFNLRSQLTNDELLNKAQELKADAILVSQVVTQRDSHIKNLKDFREALNRHKGLFKNVIVIVGGPRIDHSMALKFGFDAGFGTGTKPSQVACFIVHEYMKRHGIKETENGARTATGFEKNVQEKQVFRLASSPEAGTGTGAVLGENEQGFQAEQIPPFSDRKKRRRRGRRGGRRHRRKHSTGTPPSVT